MNAITPKTRTVPIEVVYDLVCPWCYLGVSRLLRMLEARREVPVALEWRPFLLNPDIAPGGIPRQDYLVRKFGGEERARRLHGTIAELGRNEGIAFRFDAIRRVPQTLDAHRLVRWSSQHGAAHRMVMALFAEHFCAGLDIANQEVLVAVAGSVGLPPTTARQFLASAQDIEAVHAENLRAHRLGINGVPCFVMAGQSAIAGAQDPEVLERLLDVALADHWPAGRFQD
jgi:predicted DsbA family dithiol-disulfide isomerase